MNIETLKQAGLTTNEAALYQTLLEIGPSTAGRISRKTGIHRRTIYDTIEMLIQKGLVGYIMKNNIKLFEASSPNRLLEIIKEKENSIQAILPKLLLSHESVKEKQETNFFKGKEGLKTVFEDQIETNEEILVMGASTLAYDILKYYFKWFDKKRKSHKIKTRIIFPSKAKEKIKESKIPLSEIKYLSDKYTSPLALNIYGDKVAIILWSMENPFAIVIKNSEISEGYKKYFELMWKTAKK
jgi:HTH-type transcriptional regulator, sugar sensing transcriptional regulator